MSTHLSSRSENTIILDLSSGYGLELLGTLISCVFWGISCMQVFLYYITFYDNDPYYIRFLVVFLWAVETSADILNFLPIWSTLILHYGSIQDLTRVSPLTLYFAMLTALPISIIQLYFFHRIYIFSGKKKAFLILGVPLSMWQFGATIVYCGLTLGNLQVRTQSTHINPLAQHLWISTRVSSVVADTTIAVAMSYFLRKNFSYYEVHNKAILARIFIVVVNTGIWTAAMAVISLVLLLAFESTNLFLLIEVPLGLIYLNTFLANLNARHYIKGRRSEWCLSSSNVPSQFTFGLQRINTTQTPSEEGTERKSLER